MNVNTISNWKKTVALKIELYAREIFNTNDLTMNAFFTADSIELNCYEKFEHLLNKIFDKEIDNASNEFMLTYSKYNNKTMREIGEDVVLKMLEDFEKIFLAHRKEIL